MTAQPQAQPAISAFLVEDDFIFRTGLRVWLTQQAGITVIGEADRERTALTLIEQTLRGDRPDPTSSSTRSTPAPDTHSDTDSETGEIVYVAIVSLSLEQLTSTPSAAGIRLTESLRQRYPTLPILTVAAALDASTLSHLRQLSVNGFIHKSAPPEEWQRTLQRVSARETALPETAPLSLSPSPGSSVSASEQESETAIARPFALLRRNLRQSGIRQIDAALADLLSQMESSSLQGIDRLIVEGQCRELRTARWIVKQLLATPRLQTESDSADLSKSTASRSQNEQPDSAARDQESAHHDSAPDTDTGYAQASQRQDSGGALVGAGVEAILFNGAMIKINGNLTNQSGVVLEIDILRPLKKRQLLYGVVRQLMELLDDLKQAQITPQQLSDRRSLILRDLWQRVAEEFFGRYYAIQLESSEIDVVEVLSEQAEAAQSSILEAIPYSAELLAHLVFREPLPVDGIAYAAGTPEAMLRAEQLLDHLIIQVGNSIVQPLLNELGDVEIIKQTFYDRSLISSREITRFRNALSWRYRTDELIQTPTLVFESKYRLLTLSGGGGIHSTSIYAPRRTELENLQGFPFLVTLALETRDAVAPQLRAVVSWVGSGFIYVLTDVLGRGIGLIVRGVIKGIGSAWQDVRLSRDADQRRL